MTYFYHNSMLLSLALGSYSTVATVDLLHYVVTHIGPDARLASLLPNPYIVLLHRMMPRKVPT